MKTAEQLQVELDETNDLLKDQNRDLDEKNDEIMRLEERVGELNSEIRDLWDTLSEPPKEKILCDQEKVDLFYENYQKFTLQNFEQFIKDNCK